MNKDKSAVVAFFMGIVVTGACLILCKATPHDQLYKDQQEAVSRGFAQWVVTVDTNRNDPKVEFQWKTNLVEQ